MSEWFKEHDWKSCVGLKLTGGSNPLLCANKNTPFEVCFFIEAEMRLSFCELSKVRANTVRKRRPFLSFTRSAGLADLRILT